MVLEWMQSLVLGGLIWAIVVVVVVSVICWSSWDIDYLNKNGFVVLKKPLRVSGGLKDLDRYMTLAGRDMVPSKDRRCLASR